jgi:lipoprotein-anchoring transpeptidase ErfK/SrfK
LNNTGGPLRSARRVRGAGLAAVLAVLAVLGGIVLTMTPSKCHDKCQVIQAAAHDAPISEPQLQTPRPAALSILPSGGAQDVSPAGHVFVHADTGTITDVVMVNDADTVIPGVLSPTGEVWRPTAELGYGRKYTMTITARGPEGMPTRQTSSFTTVEANDLARVYFENTAGNLLQDGATYGVGEVVVAKFDEPIEDQANAERHLVVTTDPPVQGAWNWIDSRTAHWRPAKYFAPGTTVTLAANIYGNSLGDGVYGQEDEHLTFRIGDAHVSIADDTTKQVSVFSNGQLVRTMPTSMGMGGTQTIGGTTLSFWTPPGVYTVMDKANPVVMDSSTFGLPIESRLGYKETISYATRISPDGIYLHQLNSTVWAQGNTDTSHGCLNLNHDNAAWFFEFSMPGDVVEVRNTGGEPLQLWQNGDWTVPWEQWRRGSKLT